MIGMQMGDEYIGLGQLNSQATQAVLHGLQAFPAIQTGVDYQGSIWALDHKGIKIFQRAVGKWNF